MVHKSAVFLVLFTLLSLLVGFSVALATLLQDEQEGSELMYAARSTTLYLSIDHIGLQQNQSSSNEVSVAAEVTVLAQQGEWVNVQLNGSQQDGAPSLLYAFQGKRIRIAYLNETAQAQMEILSTAEDTETELIWHQARLEGWVRREDLVSSRDEMFAEAAKYLSTYCSICHTMRPPEHLLANQWPSQMEAMGIYTPLTPEQKDLMLKYLQYNAKDFQPEAEGEEEN